MFDLFGETDKPLATAPFSGPTTGFFENAAKSTLRGALRLTQGAAMIGAIPFREETQEEFDRKQQGWRDPDAILPTREDFYRFIEHGIGAGIRELTPDPESLTTAGRTVSALFELPGQLLGGPAGIVYSPALDIGKTLIEQGVDPDTATLAGVGTAATMGAAVALPAAGQTLKQTLALALANPAIGAAQDYATRQFIESRGYQDQAQLFDPLDPAARSVDLALGILFGGVAQYARWRQQAPQQVVDAIDAVDNEKHKRAASPFDPADKTAMRAHSVSLEKALSDLAEGRPVDVGEQLKATEPKPAEPSYTADRFRADSQKVFGLSDEQADAAVALIAARAKAVGEDLDSYISTRIAGVTEGTAALDELYQGRDVVEPFYSKVLAEVEGLTQEKWNGDQLLGKLRKTPGVKGDELRWTGLDEYLAGRDKVTREEVAAFLRENQVEVREVVKSDQVYTDAENARMVELTNKVNRTPAEQAEFEQWVSKIKGGKTKFEDYTLPGGENYRELLLTLPDRSGEEITQLLHERAAIETPYITKGQDMPEEVMPRWRDINRRVSELRSSRRDNGFTSSHFDEKNILAHIRFNERTGSNGERILHLEEVQSDWHQKGRSQGYEGKYRLDELSHNAAASATRDNGIFWVIDAPDQQFIILRENYPTPEAAMEYIANVKRRTAGVPDAPFKKTWHELALRRMLRYAAEQGFDRVTWTTGEQQAARYDLSKKLDSISYEKAGDSYRITGKPKSGLHEQDFGTFTAGQLEDAIGKDLAGKIRAEADAGKTSGTFTGENLKIGGEGMRGFYDKMLPSYLAKFGKKFGAKVETAEIRNAERDEIQGYIDARLRKYHQTESEGRRASLLFGIREYEKQLETMPENIALHSIKITDAMRDALLYEGQPLFQGEKGAVSFLADGRALIRGLEAPDFSTLVHEIGHVFRRDLSKAELREFETWLLSKVPGGRWEAQHEEKFARAFERYLADGRAPTEGLQPVFDKFKTWLLEVYKRITGTAIDVKLSPQVRQAFDRMLFSERMKVDAPPEVVAARRAAQDAGDELLVELHDLIDEPTGAEPVAYPIPEGVPELTDLQTELIDAAPYPRETRQATDTAARAAIAATAADDYNHPQRLLFRAIYTRDLDFDPQHLKPNQEKPHRMEDGGEAVATWWSTSLEDARTYESYKTEGPTEVVAVDVGALPAKVYTQNIHPPGNLDSLWIGIPADIPKARLLKVDADGNISKGGSDGGQSLSRDDLGAVEAAQGERRVPGAEPGGQGRPAQYAAAPADVFGNDGGYGLSGPSPAEASPTLDAYRRNPENVSRVLAEMFEAEATSLENSRAETLVVDGHALNAQVSDAPPWYLDLNRDLRESGSPLKKQSVVNALRKAAAGQYARLTEGQKMAVDRALDALANQAGQSARQVDVQDLRVGDRFTRPDLAQRIVVGERGGTLLLDDGTTLDMGEVFDLLGEIDATARGEQMPETAADYYIEDQGDIEIFTGTDSEGEAVTRSARELLNEARADVAKTQAQEHLYNRAALCLGLG